MPSYYSICFSESSCGQNADDERGRGGTGSWRGRDSALSICLHIFLISYHNAADSP